MRVVAAYADALLHDIGRAARHARLHVVELDMPVHEVNDCLHTRPAFRRPAEHAPGEIGKPVGLAIAAPHQKHQCVVRQIGDRMLRRVGNDRIGQTGVAHDRIRRDAQVASRCDQAGADVGRPRVQPLAAGVEPQRLAGQALGECLEGGARPESSQSCPQSLLFGRAPPLSTKPCTHGCTAYNSL